MVIFILIFLDQMNSLINKKVRLVGGSTQGLLVEESNS